MTKKKILITIIFPKFTIYFNEKINNNSYIARYSKY